MESLTARIEQQSEKIVEMTKETIISTEQYTSIKRTIISTGTIHFKRLCYH